LVYLEDASGDIFYEIMDVECANKIKILSYGETTELLLGFFDKMTRENMQEHIIDEGLTDGNE
jgi:dGTPase